MSKKKSYMDRKNILKEINLSDIFKIFKFFGNIKRKPITATDKQLLKAPGVSAALKKYWTHSEKVDKYLEKAAKDLGISREDLGKFK